jgi:hypothetical protein
MWAGFRLRRPVLEDWPQPRGSGDYWMRTVNSLTCKLGTAIAAYEQPEPESEAQTPAGESRAGGDAGRRAAALPDTAEPKTPPVGLSQRKKDHWVLLLTRALVIFIP